MANLTSKEGLSLEVEVLEVRAGWTEYEVLLLWRGKPILDNNVLRSENLHWPTRAPGALVVSQHCMDRDLALTVRAALETGKRSYWQPPMSPSVSITTYRIAAYDDEFKLIVSADINAFAGCEYYTGDEISLTMTVTRESLVNFCAELKEERKECEGD